MSQSATDLLDNIQELNKLVWEHQLTEPQINDWVNNFSSEQARFPDYKINALYLLSNFIYFGSDEIRELLKSMYRDLFKYRVVQQIRKSQEDTTDLGIIGREFKKELQQSRFIPVGNPSESSSHLLYYFRQENQLPKDLFVNTHEIFAGRDLSVDFAGVRFVSTALRMLFGTRLKLRWPDVKRYVFIDDFCGSGSQGVQYSENIVERLKSFDSSCECVYLVLFATSNGLKRIKRKTKFDYVDAVYKLDETFKCFGPKSRYFTSERLAMKRSTEMMCRKFGRKLVADRDALGFDDCQLLIGFHHNVPDNTLPVIWFDEINDYRWVPIFKRYSKIYGGV